MKLIMPRQTKRRTNSLEYKNREVRRRFVSALLAVVLLTMPAMAFENRTLVALGDSIMYGYGLEDKENDCYVALTAKAFGLTLKNYSVNGYTAEDIQNRINNNYETANAVASAEVICVSAGGNELLGVFLDTLRNELPSGTNPETASLLQLISAVMRIFSSAEKKQELHNGCIFGVENFQETFPELIRTIREKNPSSIIITQTLYNPLLAFPSFLSPYLEEYYGYFDDINEVILSVAVDITINPEIAFATEPEKYVNIANNDIHPSARGHRKLSELISAELRDIPPYGEEYAKIKLRAMIKYVFRYVIFVIYKVN